MHIVKLEIETKYARMLAEKIEKSVMNVPVDLRNIEAAVALEACKELGDIMLKKTSFNDKQSVKFKFKLIHALALFTFLGKYENVNPTDVFASDLKIKLHRQLS